MDSNRFRTQRIWKTYHLFIWTGILCIFLGVFFWLTDEVGALCDGLGVHQQVIIYSCIVNYFFREKIKMDSDQFRTQRLWKTYHFFIWTGILCSFFFFLRFFLGGNFLRQLLKICTQINSPMRSERWVSVLRGLLPAGNNPLFYSGLLIFVKKLKWTATVSGLNVFEIFFPFELEFYVVFFFVRLTDEVWSLCEGLAVHQQVPRADLHGGDDHHRGATLVPHRLFLRPAMENFNISVADKGMQRGNFQQRFFWSNFF